MFSCNSYFSRVRRSISPWKGLLDLRLLRSRVVSSDSRELLLWIFFVLQRSTLRAILLASSAELYYNTGHFLRDGPDAVFRGIKFVVMQVVTIVTFKSKWAKETRIVAYRTRLSKGHSFILQHVFVLGMGTILHFVSLSWVRDFLTLVASNPSRGQFTPFFTILFMLCYVN